MAAPAVVPETLGDFAIEHELGRGGSGVVFAARWGHQEVALKVLRLEDVATPKERARFLTEAQHLARVQHPGVVRVLAVGELPDGRPYLAMERLRGTTLAERLMMQRMPAGQALALFEQLAAAVAALHEAGLVHRDIKPENVMLVDGGERVVLLDFGIAREVDDLPSTTTQAGLQRGTPAYMAPERFFGARATVSSDVYETAVCLYVMITGQLPWADPRSPKERLAPRPPSSLGCGVAVGMDAVFAELLGAEPAHRPRTVDEMLGKVRAAAWSGETVAAPPPATTSRVPRRGVGVLVGAIVGVAALTAVVVGVAVSRPSGSDTLAAAPDAGPVTVTAAVTEPAPDAGATTAPAAAAGTATATAAVPDAGAVTVTAIVVDAGVAPADAAPPVVAAKKGKGKGKGKAQTQSGQGQGQGQGPDPAVVSTGGDCERIAALYCTPEFKETEGTMAGELCRRLGKTFRDMAANGQDGYCREQYPTMAAAVAERLRMWREGLGPPTK